MTKRSRDCCRSTLISCMTSDIFSLAMRVSVQNLAQSSTALSDVHFSNDSSTTPAVSSNTLSNVPLTSLATLLISGAWRPARDSKNRAFFLITLLITLTKPASLRKLSPYNLRMCGLLPWSVCKINCNSMSEDQRDSHLDIVQKPPMWEQPQNGKKTNEFTSTYKRESKERCTAHKLGIVEITLRSGLQGAGTETWDKYLTGICHCILNEQGSLLQRNLHRTSLGVST